MQRKLDPGYTVRITHLRRPDITKPLTYAGPGFPLTAFWPDGYYPEYMLRAAKLKPSGRGGETIVSIYDESGVEVSFGTALCHPNDNFNRKLGVVIATGRALKRLEYRSARLGAYYRNPLPEETRPDA